MSRGWGADSFISAIYFDYAAPQTVVLKDQSAGVSFLLGGNPSNLPAGNTISFVADKRWTSGEQGANQDGVDAGQWISFTMAQTALANFSSGTMRVGVHLQGLDAGKSESLTTVVTAVPETETYAMMLAGLGLMGSIARRRKSKAA